jgi:hypothetical protein
MHLNFACLSGDSKILSKLFLVVAYQFVSTTLWSQEIQKKNLTKEDYHLWEEMNIDKFSPDGKWASYVTIQQSGSDTIFVRNISTAKTYFVSSASNSIFTPDGFFYCQSGQDLKYINLETDKQKSINNVQAYKYA